MKERYELPKLDYTELKPFLSKEQLSIHHDKHHQSYVDTANTLLKGMEDSRKAGMDLDEKSTLKALSFNIGGHILHSLFWKNLSPSGGGQPEGKFADMLFGEFKTFERFKHEFTNTAKSIEGSGWAALTYCEKLKKPLIMQIEKHNVNIYPGFKILLVLDMWEHAYYLDYKNDKAKYIENFWDKVNWKEVQRRFGR